MKIGDSVKVRPGAYIPDMEDVNIEGWQGRVIEVEDDLVTFEFDSITLAALSEQYITQSLVDGYEYTSLSLEEAELEVVPARDKEKDVEKMQDKLESIYSSDAEEDRIKAILGGKSQKVNKKNQDTFYKYLQEHFTSPCILKPQSSFDWEERHLFGMMSDKEYNELAKKYPSRKDQYEFISFEGVLTVEDGVSLTVKRISDEQIFEMNLHDLEVVDENSPNYLLVSDYSSWMTNY